MAAQEPLYDLVVLLDSNAEEERRTQILHGVEDAVSKGGEIVNRQDWGVRSLAFEIDHKKDADYHLMQFHATADLLRQVDRTLRITDEVIRFRIIKLAPGTPAPPEHRAEPRPVAAGAEDGAAMGGGGEDRAADDAASIAPPAGDDMAEAPAAEAPAAADDAPAASDETPAQDAPAAEAAAPEPASVAASPGEEPAE